MSDDISTCGFDNCVLITHDYMCIHLYTVAAAALSMSCCALALSFP